MKYVDEFRDEKLTGYLVRELWKHTDRNYTFMEVCGGHTHAIQRFGLPALLPANIRLLSGPGCPVCVTGKAFIDKAIAYSGLPDVITTTYGDLMRVPGTASSLEKEKSAGKDIRVVFSPMEALNTAVTEFPKKVIFIGIGFETTTPGSAATILEADKRKIPRFFLLSGHKVMPPAMKAVIEGGTAIDGLICPGHVSAITGSRIFEFIPEQYGLPCVVTGFEPVDILQSLILLIRQIEKRQPEVEIQYKRAVTRDGNLLALKMAGEVFTLADDSWRGLGIIPGSGSKLRTEFEKYDAEKAFPLDITSGEEEDDCLCGDVLRGIRTPSECPLFGKVCTPQNPAGACMVSSEGACQIFYRYNRHDG